MFPRHTWSTHNPMQLSSCRLEANCTKAQKVALTRLHPSEATEGPELDSSRERTYHCGLPAGGTLIKVKENKTNYWILIVNNLLVIVISCCWSYMILEPLLLHTHIQRYVLCCHDYTCLQYAHSGLCFHLIMMKVHHTRVHQHFHIHMSSTDTHYVITSSDWPTGGALMTDWDVLYVITCIDKVCVFQPWSTWSCGPSTVSVSRPSWWEPDSSNTPNTWTSSRGGCTPITACAQRS